MSIIEDGSQSSPTLLLSEASTIVRSERNPRKRRIAIRYLAAHGSAAVGPICEALTDMDAPVRIAASEALGELGDPRAVAPLCALLRDPDEDVMNAAALALARLGDPGAVTPLTEALRRSFDGRSPRVHLLLGLPVWLAAIAGWILTAMTLRKLAPGMNSGLTGVVAVTVLLLTGELLHRRRLAARRTTTLAAALAELTERSRPSEAVALVTDLELLGRDYIHQTQATRRVFRESALRIRQALHESRHLPRPAMTRPEEAERLPLPANDGGCPSPRHTASNRP